MKNLVRQTLERDFDLPQYTEFVKNLFNEIQIQPQEIKVPDSSQEFIKKITFLSEFSDTQKKTIDVYAVELVGGTKVERARSFQRNIISKLLKDNTKDAGLVAFYSKDNPDWRLSFIKLDYKLTEKGVKVEVGTPPKRYSFLVGKSEPSHTAQKQLLPILEDQKSNPLLSDLEVAFSVERVTKEFYERYRKLFEELSKDLKKNKAFQIIAEKENIDIDNFAKKLLGQIVFLYFLQKKGWIGVPQDKSWGQGDKFFLTHLFSKAKAGKQDFYDHYLEPLFYDTLNNPRRDEVDPAYSRYFDCKIPFLNGGLFEPDYDWKNTLVYLGNDIFEEIIDTFDLYNFTVKEDEPLEKEVAVDPEMLGKVFENLLLENMRKGQGAYYTPREIVHYMCQESLINHLNTETKVDADRIRKLIAFKDEDLVNGNGSRKKALGFSDGEAQSLDWALANIKVCDPACGSGAFLVGMLNEIVSARRILEPRSEYKLKKETIQECIYGVDIDPGAVDIAKLRLWLSLVVDFELRDIEPLPNLDYKIMCGNSLIEELIVGEESIKLFDERLLNIKEFKNTPPQDVRLEELKEQFKEKQKELLELHAMNKLSMVKKNELDLQIRTISKELNPIAKKTKSEPYHPVLFTDQADIYFQRLRELHRQFFTEYDPIKKKGRRKQIEEIELEFIKSSIKEKVDELDSKIQNLNMQDSRDRNKQAVLMKKKLEYLAVPDQMRNSKTKPYFLWKMNFFEVFQEKGGFDVVIANPPYDVLNEAGNNRDQRNFLDLIKRGRLFEHSLGGKINLFRLFIEKGFYCTRKNGFLTYIVPSTILADKGTTNIRKLLANNTTVRFFLEFPEKSKVFESVTQAVAIFLFQKKIENNNFFISTNIQSQNLPPEEKFFTNWLEIKQISGDDLAIPLVKNAKEYAVLGKMLTNNIPLGKLVEIKQGDINLTFHKMFLSDKPSERILVRGEHIQRFRVNLDTLDKDRRWVDWEAMKRELGELKIETIRINSSVERIVLQQVANMGLERRIVASIIPRDVIVGNSANFIIPRKDYERVDMQSILAILSSKVINWKFKKTSTNNHVNIYELENLPFPKQLLKEKNDYLGKLVTEILNITREESYLANASMQAKVKEYDRLIDQIVYKLYGLTLDEIKLVENFNK
ncbi:MAG: N-6 DNA methylase [Candidatus Omnitrophica bacterium]|nr:N-6 DNA methylase [Candidatus Omnitrophota bacterium]